MSDGSKGQQGAANITPTGIVGAFHELLSNARMAESRDRAKAVEKKGLDEILVRLFDQVAPAHAPRAVTALAEAWLAIKPIERPGAMIGFLLEVAERAFSKGYPALGLAAYNALLRVLELSPQDFLEQSAKYGDFDAASMILAAARAALAQGEHETAIAASHAVLNSKAEAGEILIRALLRSGSSQGGDAALKDLIDQARMASDYAQIDRLKAVWVEEGGDRIVAKAAKRTPAARRDKAKLAAFSAPDSVAVSLPGAEFVTLREFGALIHRQPRTLRRWIEEGKLKAAKPADGSESGQWIIPRAEVERMLKNMGLDVGGE